MSRLPKWVKKCLRKCRTLWTSWPLSGLLPKVRIYRVPFTSFKSNFLSSSLSSYNRGGGGDGGCFHKNIFGVERTKTFCTRYFSNLISSIMPLVRKINKRHFYNVLTNELIYPYEKCMAISKSFEHITRSDATAIRWIITRSFPLGLLCWRRTQKIPRYFIRNWIVRSSLIIFHGVRYFDRTPSIIIENWIFTLELKQY